jgi:hypothetical protein
LGREFEIGKWLRAAAFGLPRVGIVVVERVFLVSGPALKFFELAALFLLFAFFPAVAHGFPSLLLYFRAEARNLGAV